MAKIYNFGIQYNIHTPYLTCLTFLIDIIVPDTFSVHWEPQC